MQRLQNTRFGCTSPISLWEAGRCVSVRLYSLSPGGGRGGAPQAKEERREERKEGEREERGKKEKAYRSARSVAARCSAFRRRDSCASDCAGGYVLGVSVSACASSSAGVCVCA